MADAHAATRTLLEDRPELAETVADALAVDEGADAPWTFADVDADSGAFGELVSHGIVESEGDGYRVSDPEAVRSALEAFESDGDGGDGGADVASGVDDGERVGIDDVAIGDRMRAWIGGVTADMHRDLATGLVAVFAYLFVMRTVTYTKVFREDRVFLPSNDPYHYLYWTEQLLAADIGLFEIEAISEVLGGRTSGYPLVYTIGWAATKLFGGGEVEAAAGIVAWIPIVSALIVGGCVYLYAMWTTGDERIALASVLVLALLPGHALYSGIGFFDHHTVDYTWLALSILGVLWLSRSLDRHDVGEWRSYLLAPSTIAVAGFVGVIVAAMVHSWGGSPILLVGLAVYLTLRSASDIRTDRSPLVAGTPVIGALVVGFVLAYLMHTRYGWQESMVVFMPLLVAFGGIVVVGAASVVQRLEWHPGVHLGAAAASVVPLWFGFAWARPEDADRFRQRVTESLLGREGIAETRSLFSADFGFLFGPVDHFGWFLFVALPALVWIGWRCVQDHRPEWLVLSSYAVSLLGFAFFQIRFAGEATAVTSVFAGVGLVYLLGKIDAVEPPTITESAGEDGEQELGRETGESDDRTRFVWWPASMSIGRASTIALAVMLIGSLSLFLVPGIMDTVAITDSEADAAAWIDADADDREGPNYVLSDWGRNRMYNYQVSGGGDTYWYARDNYEAFLNDPNPDSHYDRFSGRVGYIAIENLNVDADPSTTYVQLFEQHGSASTATNGSGHFRVVYIAEGGEVKVFQPVPGATIAGQSEPGTDVSLETTVTVSGEEFTYSRQRSVNENGTYAVRVAYPGEYTIENESVQVSETAVENGTQVTFNEGA
ncbi:hypothetical protein ACFQAS_07935 [Halopenitus salinus]|uniref:dolichyl-phosphooligosaccharide-protein glycotransferase n=1 Tax=Halopenitus salinus TaxID=1198295 RepID=A0ABD5UVV7_9EURY